MTINTYVNSIKYISSGTQNGFAYSFRVFTSEDIVIYVDGEQIVSGYSITGIGSTTGGAIIFDEAPAFGSVIYIVRNLKIQRTADFQVSGVIRADVLNTELDYLTASIQDVASTANCSIRLDPTDEDTSVTLTLPVKAERANRWLAFDGQGNVALATAPASGGSVGDGTSQWGQITGLLSAQSDLQSALSGKADAVHSHDGSYAPVSHVGAGGNAHAEVSLTSAGFMSPADKQKLDSIDPTSQVKLNGAEIIDSINGELGSSTWQSGGSGLPAWGSIGGSLTAQTDLQAALDARANVDHGHSIANITGLQSGLDGKSDVGHDHAGLYAPVSHSHADASTAVSGLLSPGDKRKLDGIEADATADQTGSEIIALVNTELGGTSWQSGGAGSPTWGSISGTLSAQTDLQDVLAKKSDADHDHDSSYAALTHNHDAEYPAVDHSHSIADVTGLKVELDGKIDDGSLVSSDANNTVTADPKFWSGSQANYDAIGTKDSNTFYFIED